MSLKPYPADPGLPQLKIASDPELMREIFRRHLRPLTRKAYHIRDCLLSRVRYHQADRCLLRYTLGLVEPTTDRERSQWVTGVIYAGDRAGRIWQKLRADPGQEISEAFLTFEPVSFIPDLGMLVQVFPYDRRLPTLPILMARPSPDLEPLLLTRFGPGDWHVEVWNIEPVQYRPERVAVIQYAVHARDAVTGRRAEKRFYVKVYRGEEGERTFQVLDALWARTDASQEGLTVARPIAYLSGLHALILEEAAGTSLQQVLLYGRDALAAVRKAARALAAFQLEQVATPRHHRLQDEVAALEEAGRLLQWSCPHLGAKVEAIVATVVAGLEEVAPRPTHRELKTDHFFLDGDRLALIDLDSFARADPVLDPARVLADLAGLQFRFDLANDGRCRAAAHAFAEEYFLHVPRTWRNRLPLHYAGALLKEAVDFFRHQEPRWPDTIGAMVKEARDSLAGRVW